MNKLKIPISILLLTIGIVLGVQFQNIFSSDNLQKSIEKMDDVLRLTQSYYVEKVDTQKLVEAAIKGMLDKLDPHSVYINAKRLKTIEESFRGNFEGIGIEFQVIDDTLTVVSPITGGPSEQLGILSGDRIIIIENESAIGITNEQVRQKLRGKAGTKVKVTILRYGFKNPIEYTITRDKIPIYSVDVHLMINKNVGYVSVSRFSSTTSSELLDALKDLKQKGMNNLILDLRGNPGGYLNQAVKVADLFISGDKKIVFTKGRRKEFNEEFKASYKSDFENIPLLILVNKGSASASEIVAGAVQDWDRGLIVGTTTFGKGLVQRQFTLSDGSALRLTISKYYTPSGRLIQRNYKNLKNKEEYYRDAGDSTLVDGDNLYHNADKDSSAKYFKTKSGRKVYGGGGITPDYIIKSVKNTSYTSNLLRQNVFYKFVLRYLETNKQNIIKNYADNLNLFNKNFKINSTILKNFLAFAKKLKVKFNSKKFNIDKDYIKARLKAQIARSFWKNNGWYTVMLKQDNQIKKSLTLFKEASDLAKLSK
ncbi:MAG: S41 family peptidase [Bacteroidetes bacterium]|nr:S41 family peptidase [Bacteroidota bacterium]